jgi:Asparagine synthase
MASSLEQWVPPVDQVLFESVDRLPDQARYLPLGRKAMLRRIGLRGLDPALFERPKSGFVLPFDRWIRRWARPRGGGAALAGLPRWGHPACIGRGSARSTSSSDGATATASSAEAAVEGEPGT